ncbi:MAG: hypothetical protein A2420_04710 [Candidatus Moranbacteria bacterium RIFOXYC1_FULL_44_13]|nr:MAG: hypothetical protein A2194_00690 [Candidatus Moranbacteria bacterium RIFOXYA1_FULL_44_8]OGI33080.1 MAG: hypothetical protein A2420_04710 [Candidatus Moranbacteria bacterium RIFOXYC1_FULL_44_13]
MQNSEKMIEVCSTLKKMGHIAFASKFAPSMVGKSDEEKEKMKLNQKYNMDAIREFWKAMQGADAVLVLNLDKNGMKNYIGGNTFLEMGFAHVLNQKIFLYNPIPENPFYQTEIIAMNPIVISRDLSLIK